MAVSDRRNNNEISADEIGDVIWENWAVHATIATTPLTPQERLLNDQTADLKNLVPEPSAQTLLLRFIVISRFI